MPLPVLVGPFPLTPAGININQLPRMSGAYCLGSIGSDGKFNAVYVGHADEDLAARLRQHIGSPNYDVFLYALTSSPHDAFLMECQLYHRFAPRDNTIHPTRPPNESWTCPTCGRGT